jgi:hypothetical protein
MQDTFSERRHAMRSLRTRAFVVAVSLTALAGQLGTVVWGN